MGWFHICSEEACAPQGGMTLSPGTSMLNIYVIPPLFHQTSTQTHLFHKLKEENLLITMKNRNPKLERSQHTRKLFLSSLTGALKTCWFQLPCRGPDQGQAGEIMDFV